MPLIKYHIYQNKKKSPKNNLNTLTITAFATGYAWEQHKPLSLSVFCSFQFSAFENVSRNLLLTLCQLPLEPVP